MIYIHANGEVRKVAACKVKPCELRERECEKNEEQKKERKGEDWNKMVEEDENGELREREFEKKEERRKEEHEEMKRRLEKEITEEEMVMTEDGLKDAIGAKYLKMENSVCFLETPVFVVEVPVKGHRRPEIKEAKQKEIEHWKTYETFEEVEGIEQ